MSYHSLPSTLESSPHRFRCWACVSCSSYRDLCNLKKDSYSTFGDVCTRSNLLFNDHAVFIWQSERMKQLCTTQRGQQCQMNCLVQRKNYTHSTAIHYPWVQYLSYPSLWLLLFIVKDEKVTLWFVSKSLQRNLHWSTCCALQQCLSRLVLHLYQLVLYSRALQAIVYCTSSLLTVEQLLQSTDLTVQYSTVRLFGKDVFLGCIWFSFYLYKTVQWTGKSARLAMIFLWGRGHVANNFTGLATLLFHFASCPLLLLNLLFEIFSFFELFGNT